MGAATAYFVGELVSLHFMEDERRGIGSGEQHHDTNGTAAAGERVCSGSVQATTTAPWPMLSAAVPGSPAVTRSMLTAEAGEAAAPISTAEATIKSWRGPFLLFEVLLTREGQDRTGDPRPCDTETQVASHHDAPRGRQGEDPAETTGWRAAPRSDVSDRETRGNAASARVEILFLRP